MPRNQILTSQDLEDLLDYHFDEIRERMALYEETFQPMVRYYRWGIFGAKEMPLIDGTAAKSCNFINYCLWTYDYDWEEHEYCVDGFINLKEPMTLRELEGSKWYASLPPNVCLSEATANDFEYYDAIHTSCKLGWQPTASYPVETVTPANTPVDEAFEGEGEDNALARCNAQADLEMWCEDDIRS